MYKQCKTYPWRKSATVANIPNYSYEKHLGLAETIARIVYLCNSW
jgi:hypothetical protein